MAFFCKDSVQSESGLALKQVFSDATSDLSTGKFSGDFDESGAKHEVNSLLTKSVL